MEWELALVATANSGIKMPGGEYQGGVVTSAVQNCQSLNQLQGWSGSLGLEANPAIFGGGVSVSNLSTVCTAGGNPIPLVPGDNLNGAVPTVYNVSASLGPSADIVGGGGQVGYTWGEQRGQNEYNK